MAKQKGIVPLVGTIDGINFYIRKGKPVCRKAGGGFTGNAINNSPSMVRVRENNSEFGHCSKVKKLFKDSLFPFFGKQRNEELHRRLMQLFIAIKDADRFSERGKRRIELALEHDEGKALLADFCFTPFCLHTEKGFYNATTTTYTLQGFSPQTLAFMAGATHFELQFGVVVLDLDAQEATLFRSNLHRAGLEDAPADVPLVTAIPDTATGIRIGVLHYRFSQEVNGGFYGLQDGIGLKVLGVF